MKILVSNDDGVYAEGIWELARALSQAGEVTIVAPDREQSAVGTAVSLRKPLRVQKISPLSPGIRAYSVEGTPMDSVIIGVGKIMNDKVDLVVSGINQGSNLGEDVLISGTVGAALGAYLRGFNALAVSCTAEKWTDPVYLKQCAEFAALVAKRAGQAGLTPNLFLNLNIPDLPLKEVKGIKITRLARRSHVNTVEEGHDGKRAYYMLQREAVNNPVDPRSDIWADERGYITITPLDLFINAKSQRSKLGEIVSGLLEEYRASRLTTQSPSVLSTNP